MLLKKYLLIPLLSSLLVIEAKNSTYNSYFGQEKNQVHVSVKVLNLGKTITRNKKIFNDYQPIELNISNNTNDIYLLEKSDISLPIVKLSNIVRQNKVKKTAFKTASHVTFWPNVSIGALLIYLAPRTPLAFLGFTMILNGILFPTLLLSSRKTWNSVKEARLRRRATDLTKPLKIKPNRSIKKVIYVHKETSLESFDLQLKNKSNNELISFQVSPK
ncbi:hypothetical protein KAW80_01475 [Candidatus Babeliales bacterium]|nr:hypothetical protein [Candidatus Babeliales bacterium]